VNERGAASTELVLVLPVAFIMVLTVFQFALWYNARELVTAAAQDGVAAGRVENADAGAAQRRAESVLAQTRPALAGPPSVVAQRDADRVSIEIRSRVVAVVPGLGLEVRARSVAPIERFVPAGQR